jgi:GNAT superfamily N-acetyltransferase
MSDLSIQGSRPSQPGQALAPVHSTDGEASEFRAGTRAEAPLLKAPSVSQAPPKLALAVRTLQLKDVKGPAQERYVRQLARAFHKTWGDVDDGFKTPKLAAQAIRVRMNNEKEAIFVAVAGKDRLVGTASVGTGFDYYPAFSSENHLSPHATAHIGRDLFVFERHRGQLMTSEAGKPMEKLLAWQHLLKARLDWVKQQGGTGLTVFAENQGPKDLVALYRKNGAKLLRSDLSHKDMGQDSVSMLRYGAEPAVDASRGPGTCGVVSQVGRPDRHAFSPLRALADQLGIKPEATKLESRNIAVNHMLLAGRWDVRPIPGIEGRRIEGILCHPSIRSATDVKNVLYVYAPGAVLGPFKFQDVIFNEIKAKIDAGHPDYRDNFYVFCGAKATGRTNAMHLSYLADADGITTSGFGSNRDFYRLHLSGGSKAGLLALPTKGHHAQNAIAADLASHPATQPFFRVHVDQSNLGQLLDDYHRERAEAAPGKYASGTMEKMLAALQDDDDMLSRALLLGI